MEDDDEGVRIAIAALGSLKTSGRSANGIEAETGVPPTSTFANRGNGLESGKTQLHLDQSRYVNHDNDSRFSYGMNIEPSSIGGSGMTSSSSASASASASASTSAQPYSPATTPSIVTGTSGSNPGSPSAGERPPYSTRYVRTNEDYPYTPGTTISEVNSAYYEGEQEPMQGEEGFIGRVAQLPYVSGALKVYERGRNSSRVVKYGADLVESSVKTVSKPVINRVIGPNLAGQLDDFACRQLDRHFGPRPTTSPRESPRSNATPLPSEQQLQQSLNQTTSYFPTPEAYYRRPHGKGRAFPPETEGTMQDDVSISPTSETPTLDSRQSETSSALTPSAIAPQHQQIVRSTSAGRSRWQNLVVEAGVTAGGIGAAVSEESMKSLKYCLHWLHYATAHLDHQVGILREFIMSLSSVNAQRASAGTLLRSEDVRAADILDGIKRDVVETIRKVVDVVSKYAGGALPEPAKRYVRNSILGLPEKWARAVAGQQQALPSNAAQESEMQVAILPNGANDEQNMVESTDASQTAHLGPTQQAAERTLTFAVESLDMLRSVLNIFNDSVERADAWVERLRIVGLQRQQAMSAHQRQTRCGSVIPPGTGPSIDQSEPGTATGIKRSKEAAGDMHERRKMSRRVTDGNVEPMDTDD